MFISADGETGKAFGNETIRVAPHSNDEYTVTIRLPAPLGHLSNTPGRTPTYRLSVPIRWNHLAGEWKAQASSDRAVGYAIRPGSRQGSLVHHRLGGLREAVSQLVKWAKQQEVSVIAIERLDFTDIRTLGRQRGRRGKAGKTTRRKVCGIPTAKFTHTICSAAYRHDMTVIAVDPAYTSIWGARWWKKPLDRSRRQAGDRHQAASVVIGRRSQGYGAKRQDSQNPHRLEGRCGRTTVQQNTRVPGMAPVTGNDRREHSLVGVVTVRAEP